MENKIFKTEILRNLSFSLLGIIGLGAFFLFFDRSSLFIRLLTLGVGFSSLVYGLSLFLHNVIAYSNYGIVRNALTQLSSVEIVKYLEGLQAEERAALYRFQTLKELETFKMALENISGCPLWMINEIVVFMEKKES